MAQANLLNKIPIQVPLPISASGGNNNYDPLDFQQFLNMHGQSTDPGNQSILSGLLARGRNALFGSARNTIPLMSQQFPDMTQESFNNASPETQAFVINSMQNLQNVPEKSGFLTDLLQGAKENFTTPMSLERLQTPRENQGVGSQIGRAIGTAGRAVESPLGRGLLTAGIVGATGGNPLQMGVYGGSAGVQNQQNRSRNQLYRQQLENMGVPIQNTGGYIGSDEFKNIASTQTNFSKDETSQRKAILDGVNRGIITPAEGASQLRLLGLDTQLQTGTQERTNEAKIEKMKADVEISKQKVTQYDIRLKQLDRQITLNANNAAARNRLTAEKNQLTAERNAAYIEKTNAETELYKKYSSGEISVDNSGSAMPRPVGQPAEQKTPQQGKTTQVGRFKVTPL